MQYAWSASSMKEVDIYIYIKVLKEIPIGAAVPIRIEGGAQELQRLFLAQTSFGTFDKHRISTCVCFSAALRDKSCLRKAQPLSWDW